VDADWSPDGADLAVIRALQSGWRIEFPIGNVVDESSDELGDVRVSPRGDWLAFVDHPGRKADRSRLSAEPVRNESCRVTGQI
jgi:hypothetical protein